MSNKIIHVFNDDKFIDPAIKLFESVCPGISEYWVIKKETDSFIYVTSKLAKKLNVFNNKDFDDFIVMINDSDISNTIVFFHALDNKKQEIVTKLSKKIVKVWFIWGYDLYGNWPLLKKTIYEKHTKRFIRKFLFQNQKEAIIFNNLSFWIFKKLNSFKYFLPSKVIRVLKNNYDTLFFKAANEIDIIVPVIPNESEFTKRIGLKAFYAPFTYGCIEDLLGDKTNQNVLNSKNILVGNSADPTNNHIEIFMKLSKMDLGERRVYVPLSYGGNEKYKAFLIKMGERLIGKNFYPLTTFMSLEKYNEILLSCGVLIFNHVRQQGVGNIITMGYLGAKIFINSKSPVYRFYKDFGIIFFDINSLKDSEICPLSKKDYENNKKLLFELYSEDSVKEKINELLKVVETVKNDKE